MGLRAAWIASLCAAIGLRLWNALTGAVLYGYDGWAHVAYVLFIDMYQAVPYADQGWSYFHPPFYYLMGAAIAQVGDGDVLARGLALLGSAASFGIALLAAALVALARHERAATSRAACIAFTGVAFLPVLIYTAPMPGNEVMAAFLAACTITKFLANEHRGSHSLRSDLATGALAGLALLTKVSTLIPLAAIVAAAGLRALRSSDKLAALRTLALRGAAAAAAALVIAGPYYARNISAFGTPFVTSHDHPRVKSVEAKQPPGERTLRDFIAPPGWGVWSDSSFDSPALLRSVWGSAYLNTWFDTYRASQFTRWQQVTVSKEKQLLGFEMYDYPIHRWTILLAVLGAVPTGFALFGGALMLRSAWRDPDAIADLTLSMVTFASLAFFALFAWRVPTFAAVKASYLLSLSLPWGWGLMRGIEAALGGPRWSRVLGRAGCASLAVIATVACGLLANGLFHATRGHHRDIYALRAHFGSPETAREWFRQPIIADVRHSAEVLGAIELAAGEYETAHELLRNSAQGPVRSQMINALAVSAALTGRYAEALQLWNQVLESPAEAELWVNRGAIRALTGDLRGGRRDIEYALSARADIGLGWENLAWVEAALGNASSAARARERAAVLEGRAPRGFPYGVGDGDLDYAGRQQRWLLRIQGPPHAAGLALYRPPRARNQVTPP